MPDVSEHSREIDGLPVFWRSAPAPNAGASAIPLYLHGVPSNSDDWLPFLELGGGLAPDLPGFGRTGKPGSRSYTIAEYDRFIERFLDELQIERVALLVHDWGAVGLSFAQRLPARVERLAIVNAVPFLPGYRWHRTARIWRTPGLGELAMGSTNRFTLRLSSRESNATPGPMPDSWIDSVLDHFDQGTQRAILRLYRSSPPELLARSGEQLASLDDAGASRLGDEGSLLPCALRGGLRGGTRQRRAARARRRRALAVARPSRSDRAPGWLPERDVSATASAAEVSRQGDRPRASRRDWSERLPPAWTITAALAVVYLILAPSSPDLAAASYRSNLFAEHGFALWDNSWYGGHHLPAYSLLAPPLGAWIGPRLLAALSMTFATALFALLLDGLFAARAVRVAAAWFGLGAAIGLLSSRVPFDLGLAIGLASLLAARRRRSWLALVLALLCSVASPVAGAFLALAFLAWGLAGPRRAWPGALTAMALAPIALLTLVFPEGGSQPFVASAFYPALAGVLVLVVLIGGEQRVLRYGALLYAGALTGSYLLATAVGGNVDRLGSLVAGPVAACVLISTRRGAGTGAKRRARMLIVLAPFLLYWQANAPVADFSAAASDPAVNASYYAPLLGELRKLGVGYGARPVRIEAVPTVDHWEARWIAPHAMLARGWERQLDRYRNGLFYYDPTHLTAGGYRAWLERSAVDYVALPDAPLDYSAHTEAALLRRGGLDYLHEVWRSPHWRLFAVLDPQPLADAPARLADVGVDSLSVWVPRGGSYTVRVRFTPYWALSEGSGCVTRAGEDWTSIQARGGGRYRLAIDFSLGRIFSRGPRCR